jgi:AraC-like DNA-binding protein
MPDKANNKFCNFTLSMSTIRHTEFFSPGHYAAAYTFSAAPDALKDSVEFIWQSRFDTIEANEQQEVHERLFAHLSSSLVFSQGLPFSVTEGQNTRDINSDAVLIGHHTAPVLFQHKKENRLTGIKLKPGGFYRLSGVPASLVRDHIIPLRELAPVLYRQCKDLHNHVHLLPDFHHNASTYKYDCVRQALHLYLSELHENPALEQIAARIHLTPKTLNRYFHEVLGLAPKKVFSISRLRTALKDRLSIQEKPTAFSFYDYGYTDHSHFYKDLATYTHLHSLNQP